MCGRYASAKNADALVEEFEVEESLVDKPLNPDYNVAPTKQVYSVITREKHDDDSPADHEATRQLRVVKWGLVPSWAKDPGIGSRMINARVETLAEKPAFRRAFAKRRCLLPADGYFEWYATQQLTARGKPVKQPFFITPKDGGVLAMAGLYEIWRDPSVPEDQPGAFVWSATVITTSA